MTKFEKETRHRLYVFTKTKNNSSPGEMRDNSAHMTCSVHSHRHDTLTIPLTVLLHCSITSMTLFSAQIGRLMITNQFQEFCSSFDSKHKKDISRESKNSQDQIYSCWSPRVSKKQIPFLTTMSWHVTIDLQRVSTLLRVDPILPVSFGVSRVQNFFTGESRMSRFPTSITFGVSRVQNFFTGEGWMSKIPTSFTCIGKSIIFWNEERIKLRNKTRHRGLIS